MNYGETRQPLEHRCIKSPLKCDEAPFLVGFGGELDFSVSGGPVVFPEPEGIDVPQAIDATAADRTDAYPQDVQHVVRALEP